MFDPIRNYLLCYGVQRPWRINPIKRILASDESQRILIGEYKRIFDLLEERGMLKRSNGHYRINDDFVFDEGFEDAKDSFLFKMRNSYYGWYYIRNAVSMIDFAVMRK